MDDNRLTIHWESKNKQYHNFVDLGNYFIKLNDIDFSVFKEVNQVFQKSFDRVRPACTCIVKRNKEGEVIVGRNLDITISQKPAYITRVTGGKYDTVAFSYMGANGKYAYNDLDKHDKDVLYTKRIPFEASDAMNETGLYIEANMREMDNSYNFYCTGTNPGKERVGISSVATLVALNCKTVEEACEFLSTSYDFYTPMFPDFSGDGMLTWNFAFIVGDATGEYGLIEFARNKLYYTPYANGQANYYVHPELAEYAMYGAGYGRFSKALKELPKCETDEDMLRAMEKCMWKLEILEPGVLGYSDIFNSLMVRRTFDEKEMLKETKEKILPLQGMAKEYYKGNEKPLRDNGVVWTTSFNFGVNCHKKHLYLRLWEKDDAILEYQF